MKITDDILGGPNFWPRWSTNDLYITTMEWFDLAQWIKDKKRTLSPTLQKQFESWGEDTNQLIVLCRKREQIFWHLGKEDNPIIILME